MRLIIFFALFSTLIFAQEPSGEVMRIKDQKTVEKEIDAIADLSPEAYYSQIDTYRESVEKFLSIKKKVCLGEYAPFILSAEIEKKLPQKTKADEREKRQCFRELKKIHGLYLENMYKARKRFLEANNKQRLDELTRHHEQSLKDLQSLYPN